MNSSVFNKYSEEEKNNFTVGQRVTVKDRNENVTAVILCRGSFEKMESLESDLEEMALSGYKTSDAVSRLEKILSKETSDTDIENDSNDEIVKPKLKRQNAMPNPCRIQNRGKPDSFLNQIFRESTSKQDSLQEKEITLEKKKISALTNQSVIQTTIFADKNGDRDKADKIEDLSGLRSALHLVVAELRLQTSVLKRLVDVSIDLNESLSYLKCSDIDDLPKESAVYQGIDGEFTLESLNSINPSIFARDFLRKSYHLSLLKTKILCPKGKTTKIPFSDAEVQKLQEALRKWYGHKYLWKVVVASVNQFLRDLKDK